MLSLSVCAICSFFFFFFKQKTAYEMRISDWSSDVCSSDLEKAVAFWNEHFRALEWDTDRRHQKSKFGEATSGFASLVGTAPADAWLGAAAGGCDRKSVV